jgi:hypothetical protein
MAWKKKVGKPKENNKNDQRKQRKKATATATPLPVTADPPSSFNKNGFKRKTSLERRNQKRMAKERALSKQIGSPSPVLDLLPPPSDEDIFSDLDPLSDLDLLDQNFCNGSPHWPSEEFELRPDCQKPLFLPNLSNVLCKNIGLMKRME